MSPSILREAAARLGIYVPKDFGDAGGHDGEGPVKLSLAEWARRTGRLEEESSHLDESSLLDLISLGQTQEDVYKRGNEIMVRLYNWCARLADGALTPEERETALQKYPEVLAIFESVFGGPKGQDGKEAA